ncbi:uncharacterized protein LOC124606595 [Schistocerca americana]|uniref:uncharacterized protein LOC124606595 n=1 Tax=Schistocerca americana TaxID=7009 RepID=UPI001F4FAA51|nr:uncharacterized protein LOC124606595 [Schistocerca americana]
MAAAAAASASASASASSSSSPPPLGSPSASLQLHPRQHRHHHQQRPRAHDHDHCHGHGHGRGGGCRSSSGASRSLASIAQSVVEEEVRRVEHGHKRVLGELNLSVEAMLMPPSVAPPADLLDELLAVGPTDDLLTPASPTPTHSHSQAHEADSGLGSYYSGASSSRSSQQQQQQQQGGFWKRRGWKRIAGLAAGKTLCDTCKSPVQGGGVSSISALWWCAHPLESRQRGGVAVTETSACQAPCVRALAASTRQRKVSFGAAGASLVPQLRPPPSRV